MTFSPHQQAVLGVVSRFFMLTTKQIDRLAFRDAKSMTTCNRAVTRLYEDGLLVRVERRVAGGSRGGSGQYTYRLGRAAWQDLRTGSYPSRRTVDYHALDVASAYIRVLDAQDAGELKVRYAEIEQEAYHRIAGAEIRPDMYLELAVPIPDKPGRARRLTLAIEVDRGTENRAAIYDKIDRYVHAREHDNGVYEVFPRVVFLAPDRDRAERLRRMVSDRYKSGEQLFSVGLLDKFPQMLQ